jgi:hypothetical protein
MNSRKNALRSLAVAAVVFTLQDSAVAASPRETRSATDDFNERAAKLFHREYFFHPWKEIDHTVDGEDWSLPPWVKAAPYSGMQVPKTVPKDFPGRIQLGVKATWRSVEPEEGRFDFAPLRAAILKASEQGKCSVRMGLEATVWETRYFRKLGDPAVERVDVGSAPRWLTNYGIAIIEERPNSSAPFQVVNLDIYNPEYHQRYLKLVAEFGRSGIPQMKELDQCYLHLRSPSRGEGREAQPSHGRSLHDRCDIAIFSARRVGIRPDASGQPSAAGRSPTPSSTATISRRGLPRKGGRNCGGWGPWPCGSAPAVDAAGQGSPTRDDDAFEGLPPGFAAPQERVKPWQSSLH